jgi:uncharacterized membrane protein (Fun14 family)
VTRVSADSNESVKVNSVPVRFFAHVSAMPVWQKVVLVVAILLACLGGSAWAMSHFNGGTKSTTTVTTTTANPGATPAVGGSKFIDDRGTAAPAASSTTTTTEEKKPQTLIEEFSPATTRMGVSVVAGFVFGWLFRAFLKTMTFFALIVAALLAGLSYFGILNVDFSAAREHYASAVHWLTDQGERLKAVLMSHLPSSGGGALGAYMGFRRR